MLDTVLGGITNPILGLIIVYKKYKRWRLLRASDNKLLVFSDFCKKSTDYLRSTPNIHDELRQARLAIIGK